MAGGGHAGPRGRRRHQYQPPLLRLPGPGRPAGRSYYRLRQVDHDGSAATSPLQAVTLGAGGLGLHPNPSYGAATLTGAAPGAAVQLLDALGRVLFSTRADATGTAPLRRPPGCPAGVYLVRSGAPTTRLRLE